MPGKTPYNKELSLEAEYFYKDTGDRIRAIRERLGITADEVAAFIGQTASSVYNIERGERKIYVHTLYAIAEAMNVTIFDILPENMGEQS